MRCQPPGASDAGRLGVFLSRLDRPHGYALALLGRYITPWLRTPFLLCRKRRPTHRSHARRQENSGRLAADRLQRYDVVQLAEERGGFVSYYISRLGQGSYQPIGRLTKGGQPARSATGRAGPMLANGNDEEGPSKQTAKPSVRDPLVLASALDAESLTNHAAGSFQVPDYKGVNLSRTDHHHVRRAEVRAAMR